MAYSRAFKPSIADAKQVIASRVQYGRDLAREYKFTCWGTCNTWYNICTTLYNTSYLRVLTKVVMNGRNFAQLLLMLTGRLSNMY
jgi:hypothetical protein